MKITSVEGYIFLLRKLIYDFMLCYTNEMELNMINRKI